jgi:hypothetical protein
MGPILLVTMWCHLLLAILTLTLFCHGSSVGDPHSFSTTSGRGSLQSIATSSTSSGFTDQPAALATSLSTTSISPTKVKTRTRALAFASDPRETNVTATHLKPLSSSSPSNAMPKTSDQSLNRAALIATILGVPLVVIGIILTILFRCRDIRRKSPPSGDRRILAIWWAPAGLYDRRTWGRPSGDTQSL